MKYQPTHRGRRVKQQLNSHIGYAVYVSYAVSVSIREWDLDGDGGNAQSSRGFSSLVSKKDYGGDGAAYDGRGVGMTPSGGSTGEH